LPSLIWTASLWGTWISKTKNLVQKLNDFNGWLSILQLSWTAMV
jgi:hypothetical protein